MSDDAKPWLVKDFPVSLREKINHAAYEAKTTVPVWLVNYFNTYGIDGEVINVKPAPAKPRNGGAEGDLNPLLHAVAAVLAASGGKGLGAVPGLHSLVKERVREARGLTLFPPGLRAIAPPPVVEDANPSEEDRSEPPLAAE